MRKLVYVLAAVGALAWSSPAWAVLKETTVTLTDHGEPLPNATITLNRLTDSEPPPQPKTEKTDETGKVVLVHDDEDKKSDSTVEIIIKTSEGKTLTRRLVLRELLTSESIDVAIPSETQQGAELATECPDLTLLDDPHLQEILTNLDDEHLQMIIDNPELRTRILKLIEETEQTEELQEGKKGTEEKSVSGKSKEKKVVRKKEKKHPTASAAPKSGPNATDIVGTGLAIGLGIAGSRGHGKARHGDHSKGMGGTGGGGMD